jgi:hypothetical protein
LALAFKTAIFIKNHKDNSMALPNIFDPAVAAKLKERINKITPDTKPLWGKMNVNQCLRHMNLSLDIPTGKLEPTIANVPPMPKWLLKFFLLNMKAPKERAETFKELNMVANQINPEEFEIEKKALIGSAA